MLTDALKSALQQDVNHPIEIIVVDNDPTSLATVLTRVDHCASRHQLRYYVNTTNLGMFGNWNQGIALARGQWVTLLHDDDWLSPQFLTAMLPLMHNRADFAVCRVRVGNKCFNPSELNRIFDSGHISQITVDDLIFGSPSPAPGILVTRQALVNTNGFDPETYPAGDYITYAKCALAVPAVRLDKTLAYYRTSDSQTFKANTLEKIIAQSIGIKNQLLQKAGAASTFTYILSMAYWFRVARQHQMDISAMKLDWRLKAAIAMSRFRVVSLSAETFRKVAKRIFPAKTQKSA